MTNGAVRADFDQTIWNLIYYEQKGEYEWTFTAPTNAAHLEILVYAGIPGHTEGNSVTLKNVRIIQEDHVVNQ